MWWEHAHIDSFSVKKNIKNTPEEYYVEISWVFRLEEQVTGKECNNFYEYKIDLERIKESHTETFWKRVLINESNLHSFYKELEDYAETELWYYDNSHVDTAEIKDWKILVEWIFREYEDSEDIDDFSVSVDEFEKFIS